MMQVREKAANVKLVPPGTWTSYVGATASVLASRKVKCDNADVAGMSGYAFLVNVHPGLCPSGPTVFDWEMLVEGTAALGLDAQLVAAPRQAEEDARLAAELFERVRAEVDAGRCCVVWGSAGAPEFAVAYGYKGDSYLVRSYRTARRGCTRPVGPTELPEDPVPFDKLESPGCFGVFLFGELTRRDAARDDRSAVTRAVQLLRDRHPCFDPGYSHGIQAFRVWADALEKHSADVNSFGNAYNAKVYMELQELGGEFCGRLAKRRKSAGKHFEEAAAALTRSAKNLGEVSDLFPFPEGVGLGEPARARKAAWLLRECAELDIAAASALERALGLM
jgi:hypothetical protein